VTPVNFSVQIVEHAVISDWLLLIQEQPFADDNIFVGYEYLPMYEIHEN
jgi:hypothetical protein